jgi:hypothetical protein
MSSCSRLTLLSSVVFACAACEGVVYGGGDTEPVGPSGPTHLDDPGAFGPAGIRRLTRIEIARAVHDVFGVDATAELDLLPLDVALEEETLNPFDNDYTLQYASPALLAGLDAFSRRVAERVTTDPAAREALVGCAPASARDEACFRAFVAQAGRRALRRPLAAAELDAFAGLLVHAEAANDFWVAVELAIRTLLQHMEFLYRVEVGVERPDMPGVHALGDFEIASRLSFLMWGSVPDDALLDAAARGELRSEDALASQALRLLADPKAARQIERFHAQWLHYDDLTGLGALSPDFRGESDALVRRVVLERASPWVELFLSEETYATPALADHYGLGAVAAPSWIAGGEHRGGGILSHASFLSVDGRFPHTSPTLRGRNVLRRLLCGDVGEPPPDVDVDNPPGPPDSCTPVSYDMRERSACAGCHGVMDDIGYGLEQLSPDGVFRTSEPGRPHCAIDGRGAVAGLGDFSGPRELGALLVSSGRLEACAVRQFYRFAMGRSERSVDETAIEELGARLRAEPDFAGILLAVATSEAFAYRAVDTEL